MRNSFALRLGVALAGIGVAAAALTALLVALAFDTRFDEYLAARQAVHDRLVVLALADSYARAGGWDRDHLSALAPTLLMDGGSVRVEDLSGRTVWAASGESLPAGMAPLQRRLVDSRPLGPPKALPVSADGRRVGTAYVRLPEKGALPEDSAFRTETTQLLAIGGVAAGVVAGLFGAFLSRQAIAPTQELTSAARARAAGDRSRRVALTRSDEFGQMAQAFNQMADALEEEERLRRSFIAAVAHELRTPLQILRSQIEAMQDGVVASDAHALASLHEEVLRLARSVADLDTLASADAAAFTLAPRRVDLAELVAASVEEYQTAVDSARVTLRTTSEPAAVNGDPARLRQVVANLLSNALKFTPPGGWVDVLVGPDGPWAVLAVTNSGPGILPDELPHVFDRFFRGRNASASGSGIGLTVVRDLVHAHDGTVSVSSRAGEGTTLTVRLPLLTTVPPAGAAPTPSDSAVVAHPGGPPAMPGQQELPDPGHPSGNGHG